MAADYRPDTHKTLAAVRAWRMNPMVHDLTCAHDSRHPSLAPKVLRQENERVILVCLQDGCTYAQGWIPDVVLQAGARS